LRLLAVAIAGGLFAGCPSSGAGPLPRYAAVHNTLTAMGFRSVGNLAMGSVGSSDRVRVPTRIEAGTCTTWVVLGASGLRDVSLEVLDPDGRSVGVDSTSDAQAAVQVCAEVSGEYLVVLGARSGSGEYLLAAWRRDATHDDPGGPRRTATSGTCADPIPIAAGETKSGDTTRARSEVAPTCAESAAPEVVYSLVIEERTRVRVELESAYDAMLYLQRECGRTETELACNDDHPDPNHSRIEAVLDPGTYSLIVDGYEEARGIYTVAVSVSTAPLVADTCGSAARLVPGTAVQGTTAGAPDAFQATCAGGAHSADRVFRLDLAERSRVRIQQQSRHDGALHLRTQCAEAASEIACNDDHAGDRTKSLLTLALDPGTYWVVSDGYGSTEAGAFDLLADVAPIAGSGAEGDACAAPLPLPAGTTEGDTLRARDDLQGSCAADAGGADLVYRLAVPRRSRVRIGFEQGAELAGAVYLTRACGDRATEVACGSTEIDAVLAAGNYFVVVDGAGPNAFGRFRLSVQIEDVAVLEQTCRAAAALQPGQSFVGSTGGVDRFQASCGQNARSPEAVHKIRLARRSRVALSLAAGYRAVLHLRRTCLDRTTEVACNDGSGDPNHARLEQTLDAGTYYVFVDGWGAGSTGTYTLDTTVTPAAP
jgi:hypothetical protein